MSIGLCGAAGSGKNSVAACLAERHGFAEMAFADPLYAAAAAITGLTVEQLQDRSRKEKALGWISCSPRRLLQTLGTDWGRNMIHPEIWVMATMQRADVAAGDICITDVRFPNEAEAIKARGGLVWRVVRPCVGVLSGEAAAHESERGIPDKYIDREILNNACLLSLAGLVDEALTEARR